MSPRGSPLLSAVPDALVAPASPLALGSPSASDAFPVGGLAHRKADLPDAVVLSIGSASSGRSVSARDIIAATTASSRGVVGSSAVDAGSAAAAGAAAGPPPSFRVPRSMRPRPSSAGPGRDSRTQSVGAAGRPLGLNSTAAAIGARAGTPVPDDSSAAPPLTIRSGRSSELATSARSSGGAGQVPRRSGASVSRLVNIGGLSSTAAGSTGGAAAAGSRSRQSGAALQLLIATGPGHYAGPNRGQGTSWQHALEAGHTRGQSSSPSLSGSDGSVHPGAAGASMPASPMRLAASDGGLEAKTGRLVGDGRLPPSTAGLPTPRAQQHAGIASGNGNGPPRQVRVGSGRDLLTLSAAGGGGPSYLGHATVDASTAYLSTSLQQQQQHLTRQPSASLRELLRHAASFSPSPSPDAPPAWLSRSPAQPSLPPPQSPIRVPVSEVLIAAGTGGDHVGAAASAPPAASARAPGQPPGRPPSPFQRRV